MSSTGFAAAPQVGTTPTIALLENLPDAILLLNEWDSIAYANAAAERLFGRAVADLAGMQLSELLAGKELPAVGERREVVARHPDGSGVTMELTLSEVRVGQVRSLAAVGHDIRERKREEARLREMAEQDSLTGLVNRVSFEHA